MALATCKKRGGKTAIEPKPSISVNPKEKGMNGKRYVSSLMVPLLVSALIMAQLTVAESRSIDSAKIADIKRLVKVMGVIGPALRFARSQLNSHILAIEKTHPEIPQNLLSQIKQELMSFIQSRIWTPGGLVERLIPIYDKYLTHAEIKESVKFFESPAGKKWLSIAMAMMRDSILAGEQWEREIGPEVRKKLYTRLKREGYSLDK